MQPSVTLWELAPLIAILGLAAVGLLLMDVNDRPKLKKPRSLDAAKAVPPVPTPSPIPASIKSDIRGLRKRIGDLEVRVRRIERPVQQPKSWWSN